MTGWRLRRAVGVLRGGGLIAYPTEAVYGLGCDPFDPVAVARLAALKGRDIGKGFILIGASLQQFSDLIVEPDPAVGARIRNRESHPTTWLLPARPGLAPWLVGESECVALRVTGHPGAAALCRAFGKPLVSTSANRSGRSPARTSLGVRARFGDRVDLVVHGACGGWDRVSVIRDARSGRAVRF